MKKKTLYIILIILFLLAELYTAFLTLIDYLAEYKTIKIYNQESYIAKEIKEHFNIDYNIEKVRFYAGFPDGYYLDIYNEENQIQRVFEDNHKESNIFNYFRNIKPDIPPYLNYLIIEIMIELLVIFMIELLYQKKSKNIKNIN